jgi:hypothetical protein
VDESEAVSVRDCVCGSRGAKSLLSFCADVHYHKLVPSNSVRNIIHA